MKNVFIINKIFPACILIFLLACKQKTYEDNKSINSNFKEQKKTLKSNSNLSFDVDFSTIGFGRIIKPINCNDTDSSMTISLICIPEINEKYIIKRRIGACTMPLEFRFQEEENGNISFLITQIYHPFDDSLVFIKTKNGLQFKEVYNNVYLEKHYRNDIQKGKYRQKGNVIELIKNINYP